MNILCSLKRKPNFSQLNLEILWNEKTSIANLDVVKTKVLINNLHNYRNIQVPYTTLQLALVVRLISRDKHCINLYKQCCRSGYNS